MRGGTRMGLATRPAVARWRGRQSEKARPAPVPEANAGRELREETHKYGRARRPRSVTQGPFWRDGEPTGAGPASDAALLRQIGIS